jgi:hypothetical protein
MERITALLGAGSILDLEWSQGVIRPSSENILNEILNLKSPTVKLAVYPVLKEIHETVVNGLNTIGDDICKRFFKVETLNFEELLHIIEMCYAYSSSWKNEYLRPGPCPGFGLLIDSKDSIKKFQTMDFFNALEVSVAKIMEIIHAYDVDFVNHTENNRWFLDFWSNDTKWDIFNLSYDALIEQCIGEYSDGFIPLKDTSDVSYFEPQLYMSNNKGQSTVSHLHGSIYFSEYHIQRYGFGHENKNLYKFQTFDLAKEERRVFLSAPKNQAKESYLSLPIITGLHKTDKITYAPFNFYHANFVNKICTNHSLLIVGYSFGDLYLNEILKMIYAIHGEKTRIVLITYLPSYIDSYNSLVRNVYDKLGSELAIFISRVIGREFKIFAPKITGDPELNPSMNFKSWNEPILSENGTLMMFICGFKNAVGMSNDMIMQFLKG